MLSKNQVLNQLKSLVKCNTGQLTTFGMLGFTNEDIVNIIHDPLFQQTSNLLALKPDGWMFANDCALVCEVKAESYRDFSQDEINQLFRYMKIASTKYKNVIGILYNKKHLLIYKDFLPYKHHDVLQPYPDYFALFKQDQVDVNELYNTITDINNIIHRVFKLKIYNHRIIFTACLVLAEIELSKNNNGFKLDDSVETLKQKTINTLVILQNKPDYTTLLNSFQLQTLMQRFASLITLFQSIILQTNSKETPMATKALITDIKKIAVIIKNLTFSGKDVLSIFFMVFRSHNQGHTDLGQVFTPEHIASFMYQLIDCSANDYILDACCGSGTFIIKALSEMLTETNNNSNTNAIIKKDHLFGNELDEEVLALSFLNALLHQDSFLNLQNYDARSKICADWIENNKITRVLMNPPYERSSEPLAIIKNVLDNVQHDAMCAFLLPSSILALSSNKDQIIDILKQHTLSAIIRLPDNTFSDSDSHEKVSIFVFKAHQKQDMDINKKTVLTCYIKEDQLVRPKNQSRQDINKTWANKLMPYWLNVIKYTHNDPSIKFICANPNVNKLMYDEMIDNKLYEEDFLKNVFKYQIYRNKLTNEFFNQNKFNEMIDLALNMYLNQKEHKFSNNFVLKKHELDTSNWKEVGISVLFDVSSTKSLPKNAKEAITGDYDLVTTATYNNGVLQKTNVYTEDENVITFVSAASGYWTYRPVKFCATDHVEKLTPKSFMLNEDIGLFLIAVWNSLKSHLFNYKVKLTHETIKNETILLPCKDDGSVDFAFMQEFIKSIKAKLGE